MKKIEAPGLAPYEAPDFATFLTDLDHGDINQRLTDALREVSAASEETGLQGKLTLTLDIKREGTKAIVVPEIKTKVPKHPLHGTLFHFGANGELLREDPRQVVMKNLDGPSLRVSKGDQE